MATLTAKMDTRKKVSFGKIILPYLYLLPAFLVMGIITFYPLLYQVVVSFTDFQTKDLRLGLSSPALNFIGLKNYIDIFTGGLPVQNFEFFRVLVYNFWWAITNVMVHVPAGVLIAVLLNSEGLWLKKIYRAVYILPVVVPPLVVATVWRNIFDEQYGAMNQFLTWFTTFLGQTDPVRIRWMTEYAAPIPWLLPGGPLPLAYYAMMIANFWLGWPFMSVVATGALQSIPKDLYEAASIDGATGNQQFWGITVPLLRPAMIPAAVRDGARLKQEKYLALARPLTPDEHAALVDHGHFGLQAARDQGLAQVLAFLTENCCGGNPCLSTSSCSQNSR